MPSTKDIIEDSVGYGRPPKQHQFKKGRSGNPKGGHGERKTFMTIMADVLDEKVPVLVAGRRTMVSKIEVVAKQLANKAAAGDHRATKLLIDLTGSPEWKAANLESKHPVESPRERIRKRIDELAAKLKAAEQIIPSESRN
jgi:hypothetical protein